MFNFLRRHKPGIDDFGSLHADMHAHWLPGLDDGAQSMEDSLTIIRGLYEMGYRSLIATPHVMADLYRNTPQTILPRLEEVREAVKRAGIDIHLGAAAEYLMDEGFSEIVQQGKLLTLPGKHVLVEFSFISAPRNGDQLFFDLQAKGFVPILAHPERYRFYHSTPQEYRRLYERGIKLQVNLLSLTGYYGKDVKKVALSLVDSGMVSILGTDAHHGRHLNELRKLLSDGKYGRPIKAGEWKNRELFNLA